MPEGDPGEGVQKLHQCIRQKGRQVTVWPGKSPSPSPLVKSLQFNPHIANKSHDTSDVHKMLGSLDNLGTKDPEK